MVERFVKAMNLSSKRKTNHEIFIGYGSSEHSSATSRTGLHQPFNTHGSLPTIRFCYIDSDSTYDISGWVRWLQTFSD
jgi:hypothetical protein